MCQKYFTEIEPKPKHSLQETVDAINALREKCNFLMRRQKRIFCFVI